MSKKVYELASELGMGALDLVEELKTLGLTVRNHMSALTDEELSRAQEHFLQKDKKKLEEDSKKKKTIKKKAPAVEKATKTVEAVKKAAPVTTPVAPVVGEERPVVPEVVSAAATEEDPSKKKITVKRKVAVLKKKSDASEADVVESFVEVPREEDGEVKSSSISSAGTSSNKEYFKEELHSFTPVFIPKKDPAAPAKEGEEKTAATSSGTKEVEEEGASDSKKRLGGLAKMVAKPKAAAKVRDLTQFRADEEMKSYNLLLGKVIYTAPKKKKMYSGPSRETEITEVKEAKRVVTIHNYCKALDLANKLSVKFQDFADQALEMNLLVKEGDILGLKLANQLAGLFKYRVENRAFDESKVLSAPAPEKGVSEQTPRNPIVTIMGHVDHGKTTLLDYIRKAKVAEGEAGGITQHIGAYSVNVGKATLTFLDTPGHAAFSSMRERGAKVTDIVVLVVAADDGVMPQTRESILFCQTNKVPIIVAMNKMDRPGANPEKIKQALMEFSITPEEWGGETQFVEISALKGTNVDKLLESISLQAEMMELKANAKGPAKGVVIESKIEVGRGPVCTILVQQGTLEKGDAIVVGETWGRARSLMDFSGKMLTSAGPSTPVQVLGVEFPPNPGDILNGVKNEREAKNIIENRIQERKNITMASKKKMSLEDFFGSAQNDGEKKMLRLVVRSDVHGSFEAIKRAVETLGNAEVGVEVIGGGVGAITDSDVQLAESTKGYIIGFNMRPVTTARRLAEEKGVDIKNYSIIYELINEVKLALEGMLTPENIEVFLGRAEVRDVFNIPKVGVIAGSAVIDGKIQRGCHIRLLRDGKIVFDGKMASLKRFKDDVREVGNGMECGITLENFNDVKVADIFEAYNLEERRRKLEGAEQAL